MLNYDFEASIGYWLLMAAREYERAFNDHLMPHGITFRQSQVLGWLALEQQLTQHQLAERMRIEPPTLVGILDRMERDGWIVRDPCPGDRRKKIIRATESAEPVWEQIASVARLIREQAVAGLTEEEVATFKRLLGKLRANLEAHAALRAVS